MTNKERVISLLGFKPSEDAIDGAVLEVGLTGTGLYDVSAKIAVRKAALQLIEILLSTADTSDNTSGFYVKYDRAAVLKRRDAIKAELGIIDTASPVITSPKRW